MAEIVAAFGISHAAIMLREWDRAAQSERDVVKAGFDAVRERLWAARPDTLVLIGNDHFNNFSLHNMPAFCVGLGSRCRGHGDGGLPRYEIPMNAALADETIEALSARGFAPSFALNPKPDHAFVTPLHLLTPAMNIPIVPIFQNCNAPPLPPFKRCFELGAALRKIIEASENCSRVAVIGTGGVSHEVPVPDWRTVIRSGESSPWLEHMQGQGEQVREAITREILEWSQQGRGRINEIFDRWFLQAIKRRDYSTLSSLTFDTIDREAGNGAQELRNWLTMLGAVPEFSAETVFYQATPAWLTGIAATALSPL